MTYVQSVNSIRFQFFGAEECVKYSSTLSSSLRCTTAFGSFLVLLSKIVHDEKVRTTPHTTQHHNTATRVVVDDDACGGVLIDIASHYYSSQFIDAV
mgnify:CR=1 FL=1